MSYSIVYSSNTGNTAMLAQAIRDSLNEECVYFGKPDDRALEAETVCVGFWTDKGGCDESIADFLNKLAGHRVFVFGTAGFGGAEEYFDQILKRVLANISPESELVGSFMCQGKMPESVRERYMQMEESPRRAAMLANFDAAMSHPDAADLERLKAAARSSLSKKA